MFSNKAESGIAARKRHEQITVAPRRRPDQASEMERSAGASRRHEVHQLAEGADVADPGEELLLVLLRSHAAIVQASGSILQEKTGRLCYS